MNSKPTGNGRPTITARFLFPLFSLILLAACDKAEKPAKSWENAVQGLYSAALSTDSQLGVVGSIHHGGSLWNMQSRERLFNWNHTEGEYTGIVAMAFSPDGRFAATASHRTIVLWETGSGKPVWFWTTPGDILSMALTPNGDYALLGLADYSAVLFDIKNGGVKRVFRHNGKVRSVALSQDGKTALTGSDDHTAKLWNLETAENLHTWQHSNQVITVELSSSGRYAFTAAQADNAVIRDAQSGDPVREMPIKKGTYIAGAAYTAATFSADEARLLTGTNSELVQLWNVKGGEAIRTWRAPKKEKWKPTSATVLAVGFGSGGSQYYAIASNGLSHQFK